MYIDGETWIKNRGYEEFGREGCTKKRKGRDAWR